METEEEVAAADDRFFAEMRRKERAAKTLEQIRAEAEDCLRRWRKVRPPPATPRLNPFAAGVAL